MCIEDRLREHEHVVAAEIPVRLFTWYQQKIAIRESLTALEIDSLLIQPRLARIIGMAIAVKVGEDGDVDAQIPKYGQPRRLFVDCSHIAKLFVEMKVKMAHQHLVAGHGLEY